MPWKNLRHPKETGMFRIAISHLEERHVTPVEHSTALSVDEAVRAVCTYLPSSGTEMFVGDEVQHSVNQVNDFREDVTVPCGDRYRVVIAPMM